jgi:hypothetical protein
LSVALKVKALTAALPDPASAMNVASTINFLFNLFSNGKINEEDLRRDLRDICRTVLNITNPDLTEEDVRKRVEVVVDELVESMKIESLSRRVMARFRTM